MGGFGRTEYNTLPVSTHTEVARTESAEHREVCSLLYIYNSSNVEIRACVVSPQHNAQNVLVLQPKR